MTLKATTLQRDVRRVRKALNTAQQYATTYQAKADRLTATLTHYTKLLRAAQRRERRNLTASQRTAANFVRRIAR